MIRTLTNLILMVLICFTLTAMPINTNLLSFDFSRFMIPSNINQTTELNGDSFTYIVDEKESILFNPTELKFEIKVESLDSNFQWTANPELILELIDANGNSQLIPSTQFVIDLEPNNEENPTLFTYSLDISKTTLKLDNGTYDIRLYSDHDLLKTSEPINLTASYFEDIQYVSGVSTSDANTSYLILYYTDKTNKHIVPVSRLTATTNKVFRTTVNGILDPPSTELGLSTDLIAPRVSKIQYANGLVTCYLKSGEVLPFSDDPVKASNALGSLTQTIMDIQTPYAINKIQYLVDQQPSKIFFNGTDLTDIVTRDNNPQIYLGLKTTAERNLLTPKTIPNKEIDILIPEMIEILRSGIVPNQDSENLFAVLPEQVTLIDYKLEGVTLKLNFNSSMKDVFSNSDGLSRLMLDSLSSSFTSINGIDNIEVQIEGKSINSIGNVSFTSPIEAPKFINIEQIN